MYMQQNLARARGSSTDFRIQFRCSFSHSSQSPHFICSHIRKFRCEHEHNIKPSQPKHHLTLTSTYFIPNFILSLSLSRMLLHPAKKHHPFLLPHLYTNIPCDIIVHVALYANDRWTLIFIFKNCCSIFFSSLNSISKIAIYKD